MDLLMKVNGIKRLDESMEKARKYGLMGVCTKVIGLMINVMVAVDLYMLMVQFMRVNGKTTRPKGTVNNTHIMKKEPNTLVNGTKICNMEKVERFGPMVMNTKAATNLVRRME